MRGPPKSSESKKVLKWSQLPTCLSKTRTEGPLNLPQVIYHLSLTMLEKFQVDSKSKDMGYFIMFRKNIINLT